MRFYVVAALLFITIMAALADGREISLAVAALFGVGSFELTIGSAPSGGGASATGGKTESLQKPSAGNRVKTRRLSG